MEVTSFQELLFNNRWNSAKRLKSDYFCILRNCNALQARAICERIFANARHTIRNRYALQAIATPEHTMVDARHTIRYCDALQANAVGERIIPNARHTVRYCDALQATAVLECPPVDALNDIPVVDRRDFDVGVGAGSDSGNRTGSVSVGHELQTFRAFVQGCSGGEDSGGFHGINPFFPWRSSLGVMPYALGVTISAGTVLCVSHPGLEPAMAALRWLLTLSGGLCLPVRYF